MGVIGRGYVGGKVSRDSIDGTGAGRPDLAGRDSMRVVGIADVGR